ncbi:MAG: hypothetical protein H6624_04585 [Bdellovibrionaceae bacterium]|nr:hypothetical protein [Bdellovibrionales bacterium]MCB9083594.1 hypothetical protein [Pseudobdellovibrionaceae bacterium]
MNRILLRAPWWSQKTKRDGHRLMAAVLSLSLAFSPVTTAVAAEGDGEKAAAAESAPAPVSVEEIQVDQSRANQAARDFKLSPEHGNLLLSLTEGLIHEQEGMGNHHVYELTMSQFIELLQARAGKVMDMFSSRQSGLDFSLNGPVRAWLIDNGYNPLLADALEIILEGRGNAFDGMIEKVAERLGKSAVAVRAEMQRISYRIPAGFSNTSKLRLGSYHGESVKKAAHAKAFQLSQEGKPLVFDPGLANLLAHVDRMKFEVSVVANSPDFTAMEKFKGHFTKLGDLYTSVWESLAGIEMTVIDLQGLIDSLRYKLSLEIVDTAREAEHLKGLLDAAIELRERYIRIVEPFLSVQNQTNLSRWDLLHRLAKMTPDVELGFKEVKGFASHAVDRADVILGLDGSRGDALKFDSPWELEFVIARDQARARGLAGQWDSIRTFQVELRETYKTAHWTTTSQEAIRDSKGNVTGYRTVTHHHHSSSTDWDYETVHTPVYEMEVAIRLQGFRQRMRELAGLPASERGAALEKLQAEMTALKSQLTRYATVPPVGKDESEQKIKRTQNLIEQVRRMIAQSEVLGVQLANSIPKFNRDLKPNPGWTERIALQLQSLDAKRWRRAKIIGFSSAGAAAVAGACYFFLQNGGMIGGF